MKKVINIFILVLLMSNFSFANAMTIADVEQQLNLYRSTSPAVLGASAVVDSSKIIKSTTDGTPKVKLPPEGGKVIMQGLKYSEGSSMIIKKTLKPGEKDIPPSAEVKKLQLLINATGKEVSTDGKYGPMTKKAVMDFQRKKGLKVDGIVGPKVRQAIAEEIDKATTDTIIVTEPKS